MLPFEMMTENVQRGEEGRKLDKVTQQSSQAKKQKVLDFPLSHIASWAHRLLGTDPIALPLIVWTGKLRPRSPTTPASKHEAQACQPPILRGLADAAEPRASTMRGPEGDPSLLCLVPDTMQLRAMTAKTAEAREVSLAVPSPSSAGRPGGAS